MFLKKSKKVYIYFGFFREGVDFFRVAPPPFIPCNEGLLYRIPLTLYLYIHIDGFGGPGQLATEVLNLGHDMSVETDICEITTLLCWENDCQESNSSSEAECKLLISDQCKVSSITTVRPVGTDNMI